jgi:2-oxo-3-hexenedioate decarboxylase
MRGAEASAGRIADEALAAFSQGRQISPFSSRIADFDMEAAYAVTAEIRRRRAARGDKPVGRKIGFTNRNIWREYNVDHPIWGDVYDTTLHDVSNPRSRFTFAALPEPRIEPEIVFKLAAAPRPGMDETALLGCVRWVAHGFEVVQSIFPGWRFQAADAVAGFGLHGALLVGRPMMIAGKADNLRQALEAFSVTLYCDDNEIDRGHGSNVLGGPLTALRHLVDLLAIDKFNPPLAAGEIVTTGTLTRAFPIAAGQCWSTKLNGIKLDGVSVTFG